jgi:hypothetical protein
VYEKAEDIPEGFSPLYAEKDGKFHLTGVKGMKTDADVQQVRTALQKERDDHKATKGHLEPFKPFLEDKDKFLADFDLFKGIKEKIGGDLSKLDESDLIKGKISQAVGPYQREIETLKKANGELTTANGTLMSEIRTRDIRSIVGAAAAKAKVHATAIPDIELIASSMMEFSEDGKLVTRDGVTGVTAGLDAEGWLTEMQNARPHWWPDSSGTGAGGGKGNGGSFGDNPWSHANWNMTKQGEIVREKGMDYATRMAKSAGTTIGAGKPAAKK